MVSKCRLPVAQGTQAQKGFDAQGLAGHGRLVAGAAAGGAVRAGGVRRRPQFHPQGGKVHTRLAGDVAALDDKSTATTGGRDVQIYVAFGFETAAAAKKSRPRFSVWGTRRPRNGRGGGHSAKSSHSCAMSWSASSAVVYSSTTGKLVRTSEKSQ